MEDNNLNLNNLNSNSFLNQPPNQPPNQHRYPSFSDTNNNREYVEINRHQDIIYYLRDISENIRNNNGDNVFTNFSIVFLISLFFIYLIFRFYRIGGFDFERVRALFGMIIGVFLMVVLLNRHETNILKKIKKNK